MSVKACATIKLACLAATLQGEESDGAAPVQARGRRRTNAEVAADAVQAAANAQSRNAGMMLKADHQRLLVEENTTDRKIAAMRNVRLGLWEQLRHFVFCVCNRLTCIGLMNT